MAKQPKLHCKFTNEAGEGCKAYQAKGTEYCYGHARKLGVIKPEIIPAPTSVSVDEPEALKALRSMTTIIEMGGAIDPVLATQLSNILRPYMGIPSLDGVELVQHIDARVAADEQVARAFKAKQDLIEKSHELIIDNPSDVEVARVEAKVARDIEMAAQTYRGKLEQMKFMLKNEPVEAVAGTGEDEMYMVNGVKIVVPAEGIWSVPKTIAQLHRERLRQRREKKARSDLMMSVPEYSQVYQKMAEIDRQFGSRSQLGGGPSQEQDDFLVAEEIK